VRIELRPEAGPEADEAVLQALMSVVLRERAGASLYLGEWRRASLAEGVERDPAYAPSPRRSRGAPRA
jgi:hypothetical protein